MRWSRWKFEQQGGNNGLSPREQKEADKLERQLGRRFGKGEATRREAVREVRERRGR